MILEYIKNNPKFMLEVLAIVVGLIVTWTAMEYRISALERDFANAQIIEIKKSISAIEAQNEIILSNLNILLNAGVSHD
jgi:hypothetical protein